MKHLKLVEGESYRLHFPNGNSGVYAYDGIWRGGYHCDGCKQIRDHLHAFVMGDPGNPTEVMFYGSECVKKVQMEGASPARFVYRGYWFAIYNGKVNVTNPDGSVSWHNCLANALRQRGFSLRKLREAGIDASSFRTHFPESAAGGGPQTDDRTHNQPVVGPKTRAPKAEAQARRAGSNEPDDNRTQDKQHNKSSKERTNNERGCRMAAMDRPPPRELRPGSGDPKIRNSGDGQALCGAPAAYRKVEATISVDPLLESTVRALQALSPKNRELVAIMVRQMAGQEGITVESVGAQGLESPAAGIPLWVAKLKQEGYSPRSITLYLAIVENYLKRDPTPSKLSIQQWLASRLEHVSSAQVSNDRKGLRSFFQFIHAEGLWPIDPTAGLKHIRIRYKAREVPDTEDITKLLQYECHRLKDTDRFRTMLVLLVTTGLRVSEAAGVLKKNIDFKRGEIRVTGKGDKEGIVPLLPVTSALLRKYMDGHLNGSPHLFPGDNPLGYWSISSFEKTLARACRKLGIKRLTPHQMRHYFATHALRSGAKLEVVSKILRHASVGTTIDIYRHVMTDEMHEQVERFAPLSTATLALPEGRPK